MEKQIRNSKPRIDLTNQKFGRWTALEYIKPGKWKCQCSCENHTIKIVEGRNLRSGKTLSCGCLQKEQTSKANSKDYTGRTFGMLTAIERVKIDNNTYYICQCKCGSTPVKILGKNLASGHTTSCGCTKSKGESLIQKILRDNNIIYEREKTFKDCISPFSNLPLRFDFYLPEYNLLIEYDGEQHFKPIKFNSNKTDEEIQKEFEKTVLRDKIKNKWCEKNNIQLLRIHYKDYNKISLKFLLGEKNNE